MVLNPSLLSYLPHSSPRKQHKDALSPRPCKRYQLGPPPDRSYKKRRLYPQANGEFLKVAKHCRIQRDKVQLHIGMLDIPVEMLVQVSTYLSKLDLQSLVATSKSMFRLLLPEYLHRCGLVLKNTSTGGLRVELHNLSSYTSLGLWSTVYLFHPPEEMYCSIPCDTQEARGAIGFLSRFLLEPSNTCTLQDFHLSFCGTNPLLLTFDFVKMQRLFYSLPLTRLSFSGYASACYLPPSISLRGGPSCGSHTLTSFIISSDYGFAPGLMQTTVGILRHSHIKDLTIYMVSLNMSQWSSLLNGLNMVFLEDVELEGDIPWPALIRFLSKHKGLKNIRIRCGSLSKHTRPSRLRRQPFLPNILSLHAPLAVCHDIAERLSDSSKLYELKIETGQLSPFDPLFCRLLEILQHFQKLDHLGLQFVPSLPSTILSQSCPGDHDWDEYPARDLGQIRTLSFFQSQSQLSTGDSDMICAYVQSFPLVETVYAGEGEDGGDEFRMQLLDSLRKAKHSLCVVNIFSGTRCLKWTAGGFSG